MTIDEYNQLAPSEQIKYQVDENCNNCGTVKVRDNHTMGAHFHSVCPKCKECMDCEDGAV